jgi:nucleoid-associated protein EbfC
MTDDAMPEIVDDGASHDDDAGPDAAFDIGALLGAAQSMQAQLLEGQQRIMSTIIEGNAGGGAVKVAVTGGFDFQRVSINPGAVDADDISMLEDLVLAALRDAATQIMALQNDANPLAGLGDDLGGLGGLLGGA